MEKTTFQILLEEDGEIKLVRALLKCNAPFKKYPDFGVWSYFLNSRSDVTVFEAGPKYLSLNPFLRRFSQKTNNANIVIECLEKYFPQKTIRQILLSHYHFDHSEAAPELQQKIYEKFGNVPPIRIHRNDAGAEKLFKVFNSGLKSVFRKAGYRKWLMGKCVEDNEKIEGTDFIVKHIPGHTDGTIALVNEKQKIAICGWWIRKIKDPIVRTVQEYLVDEDSESFPEILKKLKGKGYTFYFYHPKLQYFK